MANFSPKLVILALLSLLVIGCSKKRDSGFYGVGDIPGGDYASRIDAVSSDGSVVAVHGHDSQNRVRPFLWTAENGLVYLNGLESILNSAMNAEKYSWLEKPKVTSVKIVGLTNNGKSALVTFKINEEYFESLIWSTNGKHVTLTEDEWLGFHSFVKLSSDGVSYARYGPSKIVALPNTKISTPFSSADLLPQVSKLDLSYLQQTTALTHSELRRIARESPSVAEKFLSDYQIAMSAKESPGRYFTVDYAIRASSDDFQTITGKRIVEIDTYPLGYATKQERTFFQSPDLGYVDISGGSNGDVSALSGDANTVVGEKGKYPNNRPFYWNNEDGSVILSESTPGCAMATSFDGSIIVGYIGEDAFIWERKSGLRKIADVIKSDGIDLEGWKLTSANSISYDGSVIAGDGINPYGQEEGWVWIREN